MMDFRIITLRALLVLPAFFLIGCEDVLRTDLVRDNTVKPEAGNSPVVDLSPPQVYRNGDKIEIIGTVTRKPGMDAPIPNGYVLIQFLTSAGDEIDEIWSTWSPADIPTDGSRQSSYDVTYLWIPPSGTTVRVVYGPTEEGLIAGGKAAGPTGHAPPAAHHSTYGGGSSFSSGFGFRH
jgi:hypothetical protein